MKPKEEVTTWSKPAPNEQDMAKIRSDPTKVIGQFASEELTPQEVKETIEDMIDIYEDYAFGNLIDDEAVKSYLENPTEQPYSISVLARDKNKNKFAVCILQYEGIEKEGKKRFTFRITRVEEKIDKNQKKNKK